MQKLRIHFISYFLSSEFIGIVLVTIADMVFITSVDALFVMLIISSHTITESSTILFKYLMFSQIHVLGF